MNQRSKYHGIDPGAKGAVVSLNHLGEIIHMQQVPTIGKEVDWDSFRDILGKLDGEIIVEDVHAIFGSSAQGTFNFGYMCGFILGCVYGLQKVQPKKRQKDLWITSDIVYKDPEAKRKVKDTKQTSLNCANRIFGVDDTYRRTTNRQSVAQDGLYDAALLAYRLYINNK